MSKPTPNLTQENVEEFVPLRSFLAGPTWQDVDCLRGFLLGYSREEGISQTTGKPFLGQWHLATMERGIVTFNETWDLNKQLRDLPAGIEVEIRYMGTDELPTGKRVKRFEVLVPRAILEQQLPQIIEASKQSMMAAPSPLALEPADDEDFE